jgi:hypothetical protein
MWFASRNHPMALLMPQSGRRPQHQKRTLPKQKDRLAAVQPHWAREPRDLIGKRSCLVAKLRVHGKRQRPAFGSGRVFLRGTASHAKYIGCADRLGERELALCRCAVSDRFFLDTDLHIGFPRRCAVGPVVCGRLRILDLLSARPAAADIGHRPENASSGRFSRSAAQFAIGRTALCPNASIAAGPGQTPQGWGDPDLSPTRVLCD